MRRTRRKKERNTMTRKRRMNTTAKVNNPIEIKHHQLCKLIEHSNHKWQRVQSIATQLYQS
jgi:hypothetical protein